MRLYNPYERQALIDGHGIREFNIRRIKSRIGYAGQEPVLFAAAIREDLLDANPETIDGQMN